MTWREVAKVLSTATPEQLDDEVMIQDSSKDAFFPVTGMNTFFPVTVDVLEEGTLFLECDGC